MPGINVILRLKQPATNVIIQSEAKEENPKVTQPCIALSPTKPAKIGLFYHFYPAKLFKIIEPVSKSDYYIEFLINFANVVKTQFTFRDHSHVYNYHYISLRQRKAHGVISGA